MYPVVCGMSEICPNDKTVVTQEAKTHIKDGQCTAVFEFDAS